MVDLRGNRTGRGKAARNYLGRREQLRLLLMVGSLGMVIAMMVFAANPKNWAWLVALDSAADKSVASKVDDQPIDTRLRPVADDSLPLDVFVAPAPSKEEREQSGEYFAEVDPALLAKVQDNTLLRRAEFDALFHLLDILNRNDQAALEAASLGEVGFAPMFHQPDTYRGKLVTVRGIIRRAFDMTPPVNEFGLKRYYQIWLQPLNGPRTPIVINALELPDGFPTSRGPNGEVVEIHEEATITGFFYRNWAYTTDVQVLTAPWVLAKQIHWTPAAPVVKERVEPSQAWLAIVGAAIFAIAFAIWVFASSNSKAIPNSADLAKQYKLQSVASLAAAADDYDPSDALRALAQESEESEESGEEQRDIDSQEPSATEPHSDTHDEELKN